ncbi:MAG: hypothetical protein LBH50_02390 [Spirochaetaceae bacterium]|jgi:hypothetical protein|nr:hypothetical protein [Spirochaetaceae bacterium]
MTQNLNFYDIIRLYALRNNSPYISADILTKFLRKNGSRPDAPPELKFWAENTHKKLLAEITKLSEAGKCVIKEEPQAVKIFLPDFMIDKIEELYISADITADKPFPSMEKISEDIPNEYVRNISVEAGLINYLASPQTTRMPVLKLLFPDRFSNMAVLPDMLPGRVLEISLLKIKRSIQKNMLADFYQQKLMAHFTGQELRVRAFFNNIMQNQSACITDIEESSDFVFSSWIFLCSMIKTYVNTLIGRNGQIFPENVALYQAAMMTLVIVNHYKIIAINKRNKEMAFAAVYGKMAEPPYMYWLNDVSNFTGPGGLRILQNYTEEDLNEWIKRKTAITADKLPDLIKFTGNEKMDFFVRKDKVFPLCSALLKDVQNKVKSEIVNRWIKTLRGYRKEKAMENDQDFDELVRKSVWLYAPAFVTVLRDKKTFILWRELLDEGEDTSTADKYFDSGASAPLKKILRLKREELLLYCRLSLPFWYSVPFIVLLARLLKRGFNKEKDSAESEKKEASDKASNLKTSAKKLAKEITPKDLTLDEYVTKTIDRWNQLLNKQAREKLIRDVNKIIKDYIPHALKFFGSGMLNSALLDEVAQRVLYSSPDLSKINNKNALCLYIKLFIIKTLSAG